MIITGCFPIRGTIYSLRFDDGKEGEIDFQRYCEPETDFHRFNDPDFVRTMEIRRGSLYWDQGFLTIDNAVLYQALSPKGTYPPNPPRRVRDRGSNLNIKKVAPLLYFVPVALVIVALVVNWGHENIGRDISYVPWITETLEISSPHPIALTVNGNSTALPITFTNSYRWDELSSLPNEPYYLPSSLKTLQIYRLEDSIYVLKDEFQYELSNWQLEGEPLEEFHIRDLGYPGDTKKYEIVLSRTEALKEFNLGDVDQIIEQTELLLEGSEDYRPTTNY